jgi:catechol 2,3-dioxygenase-like lactoylglutathione lyase family enzyme
MAVLHHQGLLVEDIERSGRFYCDALDASWLARPVLLQGAGAEQVVGVEGARLLLGIVGFAAGAIELFQLVGDAVPDWAKTPPSGTIPHLALQVQDVAATLARVERSGGRRLWPEIGRWGPAHVIYTTDPDGYVIELLDRPPADIASTLIRWFPHADPASAPSKEAA